MIHALAADLESLRRKMGVPGAAIGVLVGQDRYAAGLGATSAAEPRPVKPSTLFQIGSITKTVSATLALRLCDQGLLDLDRPVRTRLPELRLRSPSVARRLTLRHLLTHTGGWAGDYFDDTGRGADALMRITARLHGLPQQTGLGATWSYNNSGFYLVGRLIEVATGESYEEAVRTRLFAPLGMDGAVFFAEEALTRSCAVGHNVSAGRAEVAVPWDLPRSANPAGGVSCGVEDLLRFAAATLDGRYLRRRTLRYALSPQAPAGCGVDAMGLGWMLRSCGGVETVWHGGATNGQIASLTLVPSRAFALAVLTNANTGGTFAAEATRRGLKAFLSIEEVPRRALRTSRAELGEFAGRYESQLWTRELAAKTDALVMKTITKGGFPRLDSPPLPAPPPTRLAFYAKDRFFMVGARGPLTEGEFLRDSRGRVSWLRVAARLHRKV